MSARQRAIADGGRTVDPVEQQGHAVRGQVLIDRPTVPIPPAVVVEDHDNAGYHPVARWSISVRVDSYQSVSSRSIAMAS